MDPATIGAAADALLVLLGSAGGAIAGGVAEAIGADVYQAVVRVLTGLKRNGVDPSTTTSAELANELEAAVEQSVISAADVGRLADSNSEMKIRIKSLKAQIAQTGNITIAGDVNAW